MLYSKPLETRIGLTVWDSCRGWPWHGSRCHMTLVGM